MRYPLKSVRKQALVFFSAMILLFSLLSGYLIRYFSDQFREDISGRNLDLAHHVRGHVQVFLAHHVSELIELRSTLNLPGMDEAGAMKPELDRIMDFHPLLEQAQILDSMGRVLMTSPYDGEFMGLDLSSNDSFRNGLELPPDGVYYSDVFLSPFTYDPAVTLSLPLREGVLMAHLNLRYLSQVVSNPESFEEEYTFITDRIGVIIASPRGDLVSQGVSVLNLPSIRKALEGEDGSYDETWFGEKGLASVVSVPESGWVVGVFQPTHAAFGLLLQARTYGMVVFGSFLLLSILAFVLLLRAAMDPIRSLEGRADLIADGRYGDDLEPGYEELSGLVRSFNRMAASVRDREDQLRSSEERFRNLFDQAADAVFIVNERGTVIRVNREASRSLGYDPDLLVGMNASRFVVGFRSEVFRDAAFMEVGKTITVEGRHRRKDGSEFPVETRLARMRGFVGGGLIAYARDITARKEAEETIEASRRMLETVVDSSPLAIIRLDREGRITMWNPAAERLFGWTAGEVLGRILPQIPEESTDEALHNIRITLSKGDLRGFEGYRLRKDGSKVPVRFSSTTIETVEGDREILAVVEDISDWKRVEEELRRSEERFRSVVEATPTGILIYRLEEGHRLVLSDSNPAATNILGIARHDILGKTIEEAFPGLASTPIPERFREVARTGRTWHSAQVDYDHGGTTGFYEVYAFRTEPDTVTVLFLDITDRLQAERSLKESNEMLNDLIERTPLAIIQADAAFNVVRWNGAAVRIFGWEKEEVIGRPMPIIPEELQEEGRFLFQKALEGETVSGFETRRRCKDGALIDVRLGTAPAPVRPGQPGAMAIIEDITQWKAAMEALRRSEEQQRLILDTTAEGIYGVDESGLCVFCNPAAAKMLGYASEADLTGRNLHQIIHHTAEDGTPQEKEECLVNRALKEGVASHTDREVFWRYDGTSFPVEYWSVPILRKGKVAGAVITFFDITERREAERALEESEERLRKISEGVQEGIAITEMGVILEANEQMVAMFGYPREELLGMPVLDFIHPDDKETVARSLKEGGSSYYAIRTLRKDGTSIQVQVKATETTYRGRPVRVSSLLDVTDLRKAEAVLKEREKRYRMLYENNPLGYQSLDSDGRFLEVNTAWEELTGYRRKEVIGRPFLDLVHQDSRSTVQDCFPVLLGKGKIHIPEISLVGQDGQRIYFTLAGRASHDEDTGILRTHCLLQDISDRKQMEHALAKNAQLAAVGQVASGIAHEINNPLATISATTEALLARIPELRKGRDRGIIDLYKDYLSMTKEEVERSSKIMRDLLDFARMKDYVLKQVDITELISSTLKLFSVQSRMEQYEFLLHLTDEAVLVLGDRDRLRQVLVILLSNAVESMPAGGKVEISGFGDRKNNLFTITVRDEGPGFQSADPNRIFEPFYTTKGASGGTGLGLSIADTIVSKHGGRITASQAAGRGALMTVHLPLNRKGA